MFCICLFVRGIHFKTDTSEMLIPFGSVIVILGWFVAPILTVFENIYLFWLFIKKQESGLSAWRIAVTVLFLTVQIFVHFILPA